MSVGISNPEVNKNKGDASFCCIQTQSVSYAILRTRLIQIKVLYPGNPYSSSCHSREAIVHKKEKKLTPNSNQNQLIFTTWKFCINTWPKICNRNMKLQTKQHQQITRPMAYGLSYRMHRHYFAISEQPLFEPLFSPFYIQLNRKIGKADLKP